MTGSKRLPAYGRFTLNKMHMAQVYEKIHVIDSHTGGEPTRVVTSGGPSLMRENLAMLCGELRNNHDFFRSAVVNEPRGSDVLVGAWLVPNECVGLDSQSAITESALTRTRDSAATQHHVIFFNNVGYLGMCGHGMIGVVTTLAYQKKIGPAELHVNTPVGPVRAILHEEGDVSIDNVSSYALKLDLAVEVDGIGRVTGDVAWGGNWFFLVRTPHFEISQKRIPFLTSAAQGIRHAVQGAGFAKVDHVEMFDRPTQPGAESKNFVLCPGSAYDRSPCGTGCSAKLACLAARGEHQAGHSYIQESIVGSTFITSYEWGPPAPKQESPYPLIRPTIRGRAFITGEATLLFDAKDPYRHGIPPGGHAL